jgi:esterase
MLLHHQSYGQSGPPLIILHGLFGSLANWHTLSKYWAANYQVLAVDQRNHGHSFHSPEFNYLAMAEDLYQFCQHHQLPPIYLLGHSMGGKTAMQFALNYPAKVAKLIVVDIAPRPYLPHFQYIFDMLLALDLSKYTSRQEIDAAIAPQVPEFSLRQFLLKNLVRNAQNQFEWRMNLQVIADNYEELNKPLVGQATYLKPALFIRGGKSAYITTADYDLISKIFPSAQIVTVPDAGHWVHADAPQVLATTVAEFLAVA